MTTPLTAQTLIEYLRTNGAVAPHLGDGPLRVEQITEGNVNLIFRVTNTHTPQAPSFIVKQALPYSWRYPDFKLPVERARIEQEALALVAGFNPDFVPHVYAYDAERGIQVFEDLNQHQVLRDGLMQQHQYPQLATHIGTFLARSLFYTSDLYLPSAEKKALVARFLNPLMCKVQEDLVFTQPFTEHPNNRWTPLLGDTVARIYADDRLRAEVFALKTAYVTQAQALLHNDLHTGSILVNAQETKIIDPEFAFVGPMGHDIGSYLAHLVIAYAAQEHHAPDAAARTVYRAWLLDILRDTWNVFEHEFLWLWEEQGNGEWPSATFRSQYLRRLLQDASGFAAVEIFRRTIGLAHVQDFWAIADQEVRAVVERRALTVARVWLLQRVAFTSINDLADLAAL